MVCTAGRIVLGVPIHHRKDRLAGFPAVVCEPKLPSAKGSSRPEADARE